MICNTEVLYAFPAAETRLLKKTLYQTLAAIMAPSKPSQKSTLDSFDDFFLDGDLDDNPFASPKRDEAGSKKRKEPDDGLGLDEEVAVTKKAREPRVKLDQERCASLNPRFPRIPPRVMVC